MTAIKSIRKDLFICLNKHGEQTMDELVTRLDGYTRGQISNNLQAARTDQLVMRSNDGITGQPAYKLSDSGKKRLAEIVTRKGGQEALPVEVVKALEKNGTAIDADPVVRENRTTETDEVVTSLRKQVSDLEDDIRRQVQRAVAAEANRDDVVKQRDTIIGSINKFCSATKELIGGQHMPLNLAECQQVLEASSKLTQGRIDELEATIHTMELEAEQARDVNEAAVGYMIKVTGKQPIIRTKPKSAHAAALAGARAHGRADVLALVPIGKAVRGAEWKEVA